MHTLEKNSNFIHVLNWLHFKMSFLTPEPHQRCGVGDDDRRKSRRSPVAYQRDCDETERVASPRV